MLDHDDLKWTAANLTELNRRLQQVSRYTEQARQQRRAGEYLQRSERRSRRWPRRLRRRFSIASLRAFSPAPRRARRRRPSASFTRGRIRRAPAPPVDHGREQDAGRRDDSLGESEARGSRFAIRAANASSSSWWTTTRSPRARRRDARISKITASSRRRTDSRRCRFTAGWGRDRPHHSRFFPAGDGWRRRFRRAEGDQSARAGRPEQRLRRADQARQHARARPLRIHPEALHAARSCSTRSRSIIDRLTSYRCTVRERTRVEIAFRRWH